VADSDTPWGKITAVVTCIAAVAGLAFLILPQLDPESVHAGEIVGTRDVEYFPGSVTYNVRVHLTGFNGKTCYLSYNIRNQTLGTLATSGVAAATFTAESQDETASATVSVQTGHLVPGTYYIEFILYDDDGVTELHSSTSRTFTQS
jgi:hypothetical protein